MNHIKKLQNIGACSQAVEWCKNHKSMQSAWDNCERGDWMAWLLGRTVKKNSKAHKKLVLVACKIARDVLYLIPSKEKRPLIAIETAEKWCRGEATTEEVRAAADAAADAAASYAAADAARKTKLNIYAKMIRAEFPKAPHIASEVK